MPLPCAEKVCNSDNALFYRLGRLRSAVRRTKSLPLLFFRSISPDILTPRELVKRRRDIGDSVDVSFAFALRAYLPSFWDYISATNTSVCIRHCFHTPFMYHNIPCMKVLPYCRRNNFRLLY